jgi:hypothetical protein
MDPALVIPIQCDDDVSSSVPFECDFVVFFEGLFEMECMFFAGIFHSEVVDYYCELDWAPFVTPESWDQLALVITYFVESSFQ